MADHSWLWLNEELSDAKIRLVCMKALTQAGGKELQQAAVKSPPAAGRTQTSGSTASEEAADTKATNAVNAVRTEPQGAKALENDQDQGVFMELPVHAAVLASTSCYWKARLLRWRSRTDSKAGTVAVMVSVVTDKAAVKQTTENSEHTNVEVSFIVQAEVVSDILQEHIDTTHDLDAAQHTLRHAYTNNIPEDAAFQLLMQMALYADRWDMPHTLKACLSQAGGIKDLTVTDINALLHDGLPPTIKAHTSFKGLESNCAAALMKLFGRAQEVVTQPACLKSFCSLSISAVQLWAQQEELMVDNENTVAVLFSHWWDKNCGSLSEQQAEAACTVLTDSLRAGQVTASFLACTLGKLPWFMPTEQQLSTLRVLHGTGLSAHRKNVRDLLPEDWIKAAHKQDTQQVTTMTWVVSKAQLDALHSDAYGGQTACLYSDASLYWCGYKWQAGLELASQQSPLFFGIRYRPAMPDSTGLAVLPPVVPATFDLAINSGNRNNGPSCKACTFGKTWPMSVELCGNTNLLGMEATTEPRANSYPPVRFWKDGKLHLQFTMKEVW